MTQDELDAATPGLVAYVLESDELPREYVDAVMRARHALRVKAQLVEALSRWRECLGCGLESGPNAIDRAALRAARETP